jgi:hypothetical protein
LTYASCRGAVGLRYAKFYEGQHSATAVRQQADFDARICSVTKQDAGTTTAPSRRFGSDEGSKKCDEKLH